jgi:hypothetical protein
MSQSSTPSPAQDEWVRRTLGITLNRDDGLDEAELAELGLDLTDMWVAAREAFQRATEQVDTQISALQAALRDSDDPDYEEIAEFGLNGLTDNTRVPLQAAILEAKAGTTVELRAAAPKLIKAVAAFRSQLSSDARIEACDDNPLDVEVFIRETYGDALDRIEDVAVAAARQSA